MTHRLGLRARLTIGVTTVFAATLIVSTLVVFDVVEDRLVDDTRASAEAVLDSYLDAIYGGVATIGVIDPDDTTRFFYLDENGREVSEETYFETLAMGFEFDPDVIFADIAVESPPEWLDPDDLPEGFLVGGGVISGPFEAANGVEIDPETGELLLPDGDRVAIVFGPVPDGAPRSIDRGDGVVAVAQTLRFPDGVAFDVGVSSPLQPVSDSLDTIRNLLWIAVPLLIAATAVVAWLATSRALRPVHAISDRARAISAANIGDRVPAPAARDEIHELATTVNAMLERLHEAQERHRRLVADASHELRSPVAASRAQLEVALAGPGDTDWESMARAVLAEQERLSTLVDDLLALTRLEDAGTGPVGPVDLDELVLREAARHGGSVHARVDAAVRLSGDATLLTRAIRNLVDNGVRHADERVEVVLAVCDDSAILTVDDDGRGVDPSHRESIFDRFTRLDESRSRDVGGAGLGLAIVRETARAHGGDVAVGDAPLGGARFTLTLPLDSAFAR